MATLKSDHSSDLKFYHGVFRINSNISSGDKSIETIVDQAKDSGINFIVMSDQFLVYAEYGLPPFENVIKISQSQKSILSYGIEKYFNRLQKVDDENPTLIVIPGVDIAPHYYWSGNPLNSTLTAHQFSQQLTVFGPSDVGFYKNIPVIHNEPAGFFFPSTIIALLPIVLTFIGITLFFKKALKYVDSQNKKHIVPSRKRAKLFGICLILLGIIWSCDNRPFYQKKSFDQYSMSTPSLYQKIFDYIRSAEKKLPDKKIKPGIIWSAPEATMKNKKLLASLVTLPFIPDIKNTDNHNGFAGLYGDVSTAHIPGSFWDDLLLDYCNNKRESAAIIVGERDWHGRGALSIDFIKTVTMFRKSEYEKQVGRGEIVNAIIQGQSYAVVRKSNQEIILTEVKLAINKITNGNFIIPGERLKIKSGDTITLNIKGRRRGIVEGENNFGIITVVVDGIKVLSKKINLNNFTFLENISIKKNDMKNHYVRFYITKGDCVELICNPFFITN